MVSVIFFYAALSLVLALWISASVLPAGIVSAVVLIIILGVSLGVNDVFIDSFMTKVVPPDISSIGFSFSLT